MDANPNNQLKDLQTELEKLRIAKAISDTELEELRGEREAHAKERQAWEKEKKAWEVEKESFAKQKRSWESERQARALEKEFEEEYQTLHSQFMQMIQGVNDATAGMVGQGYNVEDETGNIIEAVSEPLFQKTAEEAQQQDTEKEKCKVIIGNVRRVGKQWLECVETATKEEPDFVFRVDDVQARLDAATDLLEMMQDSEEPTEEF